MDIIKSIILGITHGFSEFLPVSSSGHISLIEHFSGVDTIPCLLSAMLHIGALISVLCVYYKPVYELFEEFFKVIKDITSKKFSFKFKEMNDTRRMFFMLVFSCIPLLLLFIPVGNGNVLWDIINGVSHDNSIKAEGICFMLSGFILLLTSIYTDKKSKPMKIAPFSAFLIGFVQLVSLCLPGFSRIGLIIATGLFCSISKKNILRYVLLLSVPVNLLSCALEFGHAVTGLGVVLVIPLLSGFLASVIAGVLAIRLLKIIVEKNLFKYFGFYSLALGFVATVIGAVEVFIK